MHSITVPNNTILVRQARDSGARNTTFRSYYNVTSLSYRRPVRHLLGRISFGPQHCNSKRLCHRQATGLLLVSILLFFLVEIRVELTYQSVTPRRSHGKCEYLPEDIESQFCCTLLSIHQFAVIYCTANNRYLCGKGEGVAVGVAPSRDRRKCCCKMKI